MISSAILMRFFGLFLASNYRISMAACSWRSDFHGGLFLVINRRGVEIGDELKDELVGILRGVGDEEALGLGRGGGEVAGFVVERGRRGSRCWWRDQSALQMCSCSCPSV